MVIAIVLVAILALVAVAYVSINNGIVTKNNRCDNAWQTIDAQLQRRNDLIPNLVETVKGYAKHEQETLENVINARSKATQVTLDAATLTPEKLKEFQEAQGELGSALGKLIAIQENYPDLKANENFQQLQVQLEGTENRINEARNKFNTAVQNYNLVIRSFPKNILAGLFNFDKMAKFEADAAAQKAPEVKF
jgi:LemA protein